jgi:AcrR family transcriptional regulator
MCARTGRAKPLSRDDRRAAIMDAVIPLLLENGAAVTTAEIAEAAGIAEGTIFRAFSDKATLLREAARRMLDPLPVREILRSIPADAPFEDQVVEAARALSAYFERGAALMGMLRGVPHHTVEHSGDARRHTHEALALITDDLAGIMGRHPDRLSTTPGKAAVALRGLIFTNVHPLLAPEEKLTVEEAVSILLDGVLAPDRAAT